MTRLFVALEIPEEVRDEIISYRKRICKEDKNFRWEKKEKLHITLKFIGEVDNELVPEISEELRFTESYEAFTCSLTRFGFFFREKIPKILFVGLKTSEKIYTLAGEINSCLEKFSIPAENRKFKSHITILRLKGNPGEHFIESFQKFAFPQNEFKAGVVSLVKSELLPQGSKYTVINKYKLK